MKDYIFYDLEFGGVLRNRIKDVGLKIEILWCFRIRELIYYKYLRGKMFVLIVRFLLEEGVVFIEELREVFRGFFYSILLIFIFFEFSEEFWYFFGFVVGDGYFVKKGVIMILVKDRIEDIVKVVKEIVNFF